MHQQIRSFDELVAKSISMLPRWLEPVMLAATFMGFPVVIVVLAGIIATLSWVKGKHRITYALVASVVALGLGSILKLAVRRDRPQTIYAQNMKIHSYSFPSGHAFGAVVFYGLLAYLAYRYLPQPYDIVITSLLILLVVLIGISRIYLGAHFPSDVVGGWILGGISLILIIKFIKP